MYKPGTGGLISPYDNRLIDIGTVTAPVGIPAAYKNDVIHKIITKHQRKLGACGGHMIFPLMRWFFQNKTGKVIDFSPRFAQALAKIADGYEGEGTWLTILLKQVSKYGCATEKTCPNNTTLTYEQYVYQREFDNLPKEAVKEAEQYKGIKYAAVSITKEALKQAIYQHGAVGVLTRLGPEWYTNEQGKVSWAEKDIYPIDHLKKIESGHFYVLYGYDEKDNFYLCNSWSNEWAKDGKNYWNWNLYKDRVNEAYVITDIPDSVIEKAKSTPFIFTKDLKYGQISEDVRQLQKFLNKKGYKVTELGQETTYFGISTRKGLIRFQDDQNIALTYSQRHVVEKAVAGPRTRDIINFLNRQ